MNLEIIVLGVPEPKGSFTILRHGKKTGIMWGRGDGHQRLQEWTFRIRSGAERSMRANHIESPSDAPMALDVTFYMPRPKSAPKSRVHVAVRPDVDKLCRSVGDALQGVCYTEDSRIVNLMARKVYADDENPPGASIRIWSVG